MTGIGMSRKKSRRRDLFEITHTFALIDLPRITVVLTIPGKINRGRLVSGQGPERGGFQDNTFPQIS